MLATKADEKLVNILRQTNNLSINTIKMEHCQYLISITPMDLALAEQELFNSGIDIKFIEDNILEQLKLLVSPMAEGVEFLPESHIVKKLIAEHHQVDYLLDEIEQLNEKLKEISHQSTAGHESQNLIHIARHLNAAIQHAEIEENLIFPVLEKEGIEVIPDILRVQISEIVSYSSHFFALAFLENGKLPNKVQKIEQIRARLIPLKRKYRLIEENLLYPVALEIVNEQTWQKVKEQCEKIGFCCF